MRNSTNGFAVVMVLMLLVGVTMSLSIYWRSIVYASQLYDEQYHWYKKRYQKEALFRFACSICIDQFEQMRNCCTVSGGTVTIPIPQIPEITQESAHWSILVSMIDPVTLTINLHTPLGESFCCIHRSTTESGTRYTSTAWSIG
jgi:hypothetical protein